MSGYLRSRALLIDNIEHVLLELSFVGETMDLVDGSLSTFTHPTCQVLLLLNN
jgi:hypothetical protein